MASGHVVPAFFREWSVSIGRWGVPNYLKLGTGDWELVGWWLTADSQSVSSAFKLVSPSNAHSTAV